MKEGEGKKGERKKKNRLEGENAERGETWKGKKKRKNR